MSRHILELKAERHSLTNEARALTSRADDQVSADDLRRIDALSDRIERLNGDIARAEREQELDHAAAFAGGRRTPGLGVPMTPDMRMSDLPSARDLPANVSAERYLRAMITGRDPELRNQGLGLDDTNVPVAVAAQLFDTARAMSRVVAAGAATIPLATGLTRVPVVLEDPVPAWRDEFEPVESSRPNIVGVDMDAKTLAVMTRVSWEALDDGIPETSALVSNLIAAAIAAELDRAALLGSGVDREPQGLMVDSDVPTTTWADGGIDYAALIAAHGAVRQRAFLPGQFILSVRDHTALMASRATDDQFIVPPPSIAPNLLAYTSKLDEVIPSEGSNEGESKLITGQWNEFLIGMRTDLTMQVLRERFADTGEVAVVAWMRADMKPVRPEAFQVVDGIMPPGTSPE